MGDRFHYSITNPRIPVFMKRFRKEVDRYGGVATLAKITGISRPTINYWYNGERTPDAESLITLSKKLNVSVDYLLGRSNTRNRDEKIQRVTNYTGLSENAINHIREALVTMKALGGVVDTIDWFFSQEYFLRLIVATEKYRQNANVCNKQYLTLDNDQQDINFIMKQAAKLEMVEVVSDMAKDIDNGNVKG